MKKTIAVGHPTMGRGGSESTCMWLIQAIKADFDVTLVTTRSVDLDDLNQFYGTSVGQDEVQVRVAPAPSFMQNNSNIAGLRRAFYSRFTKQIGKEYDLCISSYNLSDWGVPALHFIADFVWDRSLAQQFDPVSKHGSKLIHRDNLLRKCYLGTCRVIGGKRRPLSSFFNGKHVIASNSHWSAKIMQEKHGYARDENVYPPVASAFKQIPWDQKKYAFVSIGRIAHEKRIEQQIDILNRIRELGHNIAFHLIGGVGDDPYGRMIRSQCAEHPWITLEGRKSGAEKEALLTGCKFAIHTRPHEAFGITVAELVKAGCIPFIPNCGGQTEIVPFAELQFASTEQAVQKIDSLLRDETKQQLMLQKLESQKELFSTEQFCRQARRLVEHWLMTHSTPKRRNT